MTGGLSDLIPEYTLPWTMNVADGKKQVVLVRPATHLHCLCYIEHWGRDKMTIIFAHDIYRFIFFNENRCILTLISLEIIPNGLFVSIGSDIGLAQNSQHLIIWTNDGMLLTHICVTRPASIYYHIEAWAKWLSFCRPDFRINFLERQFVYSKWNFTEICSYGSNFP